ncbi:MAG: glycosyltransferase family 2 protein [Candidatus Omnitrophota bacterium]|nr:MAG: glycosyltransferase family 2 protein [Candidatus Omnitrophota bacterium]
MKEISVVLTTYMLGKYIRVAIESVLKQTFKNYELIIIDDGSTDSTEQEIFKFKDERIKYIRQDHSGLPAKARNKGIEIATGKLIAFFDGDDFWYPGKLQRCLEIFNNDSTVDILCHDLSFSRLNDGKVFKRRFFGPYQDDMYKQLLLKGNALTASSTVMKRSIFSEDRYLFSEDKKFFSTEDYDLWLRLAKSKRYRFFYLPEILGAHRVFENSATLSNIERHTLNMLYLFDENEKDPGFDEKGLKRVIKKRKSQVMFSAALAFNYHKKFSQSLAWHLKAIKQYPLYLKPYLTFFASLFRIKLGYL